MYWMGSEPTIPVVEPEQLRDILFAGPEVNGKSASSRRMAQDLVGRGIVMANGQDWQQQRQVVAPAFHTQSLAVRTPFHQLLHEFIPLEIHCEWNRKEWDVQTLTCNKVHEWIKAGDG